MPQQESCPELRDTRHTPLARPRRSPTLQPTNSVPPPMRSRQRGLLLRRARAIVLVGASAAGSVSGCQRRFATLCWMTSACAMGSVGRRSIASGPPRDHCPTTSVCRRRNHGRVHVTIDRGIIHAHQHSRQKPQPARPYYHCDPPSNDSIVAAISLRSLLS